ncbi:unnamed protein product [Acanthoscelides obtectus]|uniref:Uncharacterized protein n=1 Tax=Acanthoscelides obtectus TaxID=200917 RepID=A0A9P0Q223_ACAOB|nr:unnamed protein product [Acanthoscelides obtectus]CAK1656616.1 hypothetical protein AOBTE_LOCUS19833 [Acanthoscelides obtectus]
MALRQIGRVDPPLPKTHRRQTVQMRSMREILREI